MIYFLTNIFFFLVKETSQVHLLYILLKTVIKIEKVLFSGIIVSQIDFDLESILKKLKIKFGRFFCKHFNHKGRDTNIEAINLCS